MTPGSVLPQDFYARDPKAVARDLLGKVITRGRVAARIVEVEAYLGERDPGSHAFRGPTHRNATMFGPPGFLYVYFTYGMHWCANVVCTTEGEAGAVLLRAGAPLSGLATMRKRRPAARRDLDLCSGPAKLCEALGITGRDDGTDLRGGPIRIVDDREPAPPRRTSPRIGLAAGRGDHHRWRWYVPGDPNVSGPKGVGARTARRQWTERPRAGYPGEQRA